MVKSLQGITTSLNNKALTFEFGWNTRNFSTFFCINEFLVFLDLNWIFLQFSVTTRSYENISILWIFLHFSSIFAGWNAEAIKMKLLSILKYTAFSKFWELFRINWVFLNCSQFFYICYIFMFFFWIKCAFLHCFIMMNFDLIWPTIGITEFHTSNRSLSIEKYSRLMEKRAVEEGVIQIYLLTRR
jgi:hypothetical protein